VNQLGFPYANARVNPTLNCAALTEKANTYCFTVKRRRPTPTTIQQQDTASVSATPADTIEIHVGAGFRRRQTPTARPNAPNTDISLTAPLTLLGARGC
jgi:hypothetical protein